MPKVASVQTDFVVDIVNEVQLQTEENHSQDGLFKLVDKIKFDEMFGQYHPESNDDPCAIWNMLLGNPEDPKPAYRRPFMHLDVDENWGSSRDHKKKSAPENQQATHLTEDSCQKILEHTVSTLVSSPILGQ